MRNPFGLIEIDTVLSPARRKLFHYFWVTFALLLVFSTRPLWMGAGEYPQVPFAGWLVNVGRTADRIACGLAFVPLCLMLVSGDDTRVWRACCCAFICGMCGLFLLDQHRFQPWAWQFVLIGCAALWFPTRSVAYWWRWLAISIYLFSAVSKFDVSFADELGKLFLRTAGSFIGVDATAWPVGLQRIGALSFPVWEFAVGLLLCFPRTRFAGMWMAWVMHGMLLAILGPWGLNHHWGVLLWNGFFICQAGLLFWPCMYQGPSCPLRVPGGEMLADLKGRVGAVAMTVILWLPVLEPLGLYDHWPSWGLYASHVERVNLFIHREARKKLPADVQRHLVELLGVSSEWLGVKLDRWSLAALKAPIYPQGRFQIGVCTAVIERYRLQGEFRVVYEGAAGRLTGNRRTEEFRTWEELQKRVEGFRLNARPRMGTFAGWFRWASEVVWGWEACGRTHLVSFLHFPYDSAPLRMAFCAGSAAGRTAGVHRVRGGVSPFVCGQGYGLRISSVGKSLRGDRTTSSTGRGLFFGSGAERGRTGTEGFFARRVERSAGKYRGPMEMYRPGSGRDEEEIGGSRRDDGVVRPDDGRGEPAGRETSLHPVDPADSDETPQTGKLAVGRGERIRPTHQHAGGRDLRGTDLATRR